jgi:molecular chaperone Hsp33
MRETDSPLPLPERDSLWRFVLARSGVRGLLVRLDQSWQRVLARAEYPADLAALLGQNLAAAALFTGHVKMQGRLSIQLRATGPVPRVFAECSHQGRLRGLAQWEPPLPEPLTLAALGSDQLLAITIESETPGQREPRRYQGLVPLEGADLAAAFEAYFDRSEQLPTRLILAADTAAAAGLMLQKLPDGGDADGEGWATAQALFDTLGPEELLASDPQSLLFRLFNEEGIRVLDTRLLAFGCSCSRERVAQVLLSLGRDEAFAAAEGRDDALVHCEFCGASYRFDRVDLGQLFSEAAGAGPSRAQ